MPREYCECGYLIRRHVIPNSSDSFLYPYKEMMPNLDQVFDMDFELDHTNPGLAVECPKCGRLRIVWEVDATHGSSFYRPV